MPERQSDSHIEGGGEPSIDGISSIIKDLDISSEVAEMIRKLEGTKKEECLISLQDILTEVKEKSIGNADRDKKVRETLASEYGIKYGANISGIIGENGLKSGVDIYSDIDKRGKILGERLEAVKSLDTTIVNDELQKAKSTTPLPDTVRTNISKATGVPEEGIDAAIKSGSNPLLSNLVDTYYLTFAEDQITSKLPEGKKGDTNAAFSNLRASAREYGVLAEFRSDKLESRITDKPARSQQLILSGATAITGGRGDIPVVREGERLFFKSLDGKEVTHSMDISKIPPVVTKFRGVIEISYAIPDTRERERQAQYKTELDKNKKDELALTGALSTSHEKVQARLSQVDQKIIDTNELKRIIDSLTTTQSIKDRKNLCDRLILICETAEKSSLFIAKAELQGDILTTSEGFQDYFIGQRIQASELKKKLGEQERLQGLIKPILPPNMSPKDAEMNTTKNFDGLERLGISQFASMSEVYAFLMSANGPEIGNRWTDSEAINASLTSEVIGESMWKKLVKHLGTIQDKVSGTNVANADNSTIFQSLQKTGTNGRKQIIEDLESYRVTNKSGGKLTKQDFDALLS